MYLFYLRDSQTGILQTVLDHLNLLYNSTFLRLSIDIFLKYKFSFSFYIFVMKFCSFQKKAYLCNAF